MSDMFKKMGDIPIDIVNEMQDTMKKSKEIYNWAVWFLENQDNVVSFPDGKEKVLKEHYLENFKPEELDLIVKDMQKYVNEFKLNCG